MSFGIGIDENTQYEAYPCPADEKFYSCGLAATWNNGGDTATLKDTTGADVDSCTYEHGETEASFTNRKYNLLKIGYLSHLQAPSKNGLVP